MPLFFGWKVHVFHLGSAHLARLSGGLGAASGGLGGLAAASGAGVGAWGATGEPGTLCIVVNFRSEFHVNSMKPPSCSDIPPDLNHMIYTMIYDGTRVASKIQRGNKTSIKSTIISLVELHGGFWDFTNTHGIPLCGYTEATP